MTMSLPNLPSERILITPEIISSNLSEIICEEDSGDQPIDFSKKYCETKLNTDENGFSPAVKSFMYAETDLDQPTNYSLRYAEEDSDTDQRTKISKTEYVPDTIKTYCTEDTPYETPFTFSTSTSMSDLRIDHKLEAKATDKANVPQFSSGLMSPEKPVNYCDEGTPGYFSRVPSCGSLNLLPKAEAKETDDKTKPRRTESKAVKFEDVVNYAEETPLMFSRSSSLASLDSIEQHSIHDDRSSIVSDFSRLTSGLISPSELPDSPSQTVPPSPKSRQKPLVFPKKQSEEAPQPPQLPKSSVFEDVVKKFKTETTPLHFSTATSLSSLLDLEEKHEVKDEIVDGMERLDINEDLSESSEDEDILAACINIGMQSNKYCQAKSKTPPVTEVINVVGDSLRTYCTEDTPAVLSHAGSNSDLSLLSMATKSKDEAGDGAKCETQSGQFELKVDAVDVQHQDTRTSSTRTSRPSSFSSSLSDQSEDALLQECILAGMPKSATPAKTLDLVQTDDSDDDILDDCINMGMTNNRYSQQKMATLPQVVTDSVRSYYTEDTPAILSHAGSNSDLSILSLNGSNDFGSESDDDKLLQECVQLGMTHAHEESDSDSDDSALLEQCIQAGMPQKPQSRSHDLTAEEKALLQRCILDGMSKCSAGPRRHEEDATELTAAEQALLRQCILSGMPKNKNPTQEGPSELSEAERALLQQCIMAGMPKNKNLGQGGPSKKRETSELSEAERALLQQCIMAGMPRSGSKTSVRQLARKSEPEHVCCVHCPRNQSKGKQVKSRRKKEKSRETRDMNVVYVTSQILAMRREVVERMREEWV